MTPSNFERLRILALDPAGRGLGFAVIEGPTTLVDWGFRNTRGNRDAQCASHLKTMLGLYQPDVLVLESYEPGQRTARVAALGETFARIARQKNCRISHISRYTVRTQFALGNKHDIAKTLTARFPDLVDWCPPRRKIWQPEDPRINIFDALALACTYLDRQMPKPPEDS